ncbi:thiaminase II [Eilatimonas milleporae]|uniref:Aminopyrimidine aminohydrolase n=1 Tax=Eilatimonas milleporae TaxID=911205 RepID=A0A3M0CNL3_9PROT|nr:thiaminase II [Eilatimonas milleporae]RMB04843.1 thiaminase/transcriptional activator TenA [Eilatimonas milleporae]
MTIFSEDAWDDTAALRRAIHDLPFNRDLADGSLTGDRFRFYMIQDALYLEQYARALATAAAKAPEPDAMERFALASQEALVVERALHGGFFETFGITADEAAAASPSPTCYGYTNFLLSTAHTGSYEELVAAILPCFWIYWDVGRYIAGKTGPDNPYQAWIDTYSDADFGDAVEAVIAITNRAAATASATCRNAMLKAFRRSTQYEWMFWDSAYRLETWPIGS